MKDVGKPCEGEPHARIDGGRLETERRPGHRSEAARRGNPGKSGCGTYRRATSPRQPPTLHRYGNSARIFDAISQYALERLAGFAGKRHKRSRIWGMRLVTCASPDNLGLITLCGTVIAPRPFRPWRAPAERRR